MGDDALKLLHRPIEGLDLPNGVNTANSICFSPDSKKMYIADSYPKIIYSYDYEDGSSTKNEDVVTLSNKCITCQYDKGDPDGSIVDKEGYIWNAVWGEGKINRIDPNDGNIVYTIYMPDSSLSSQVTCCCFGGPKLDILFITSASDGINKINEPCAGALYAVKVPFQGRIESRFIV